MSFFGMFGFGKKNCGSAGTTGRSKKYYIVDCSMMDSSKGERIRMAPRNQLDMLRRLSRFAKKEQIEMCAVFDGKELRDAPDGKKYMDVMVCYAPRMSDIPQAIGKMCAGRKAGTTLVITSDKAVEQVSQRQGSAIMHCSTFRKALEADGGGSSSGGSDRSSGRPERERSQNRRGNRPGGFGQRRPPRQNENAEVPDRKVEKEDTEPLPEEEKSTGRAKEDTDSVSDLIDLV